VVADLVFYGGVIVFGIVMIHLNPLVQIIAMAIRVIIMVAHIVVPLVGSANGAQNLVPLLAVKRKNVED